MGPQPNQVGMAHVCINPDLGDPVTGEPLMCQVCRSNENFCGIKGGKWKQRQATPTTDKKVIELL